MTKTHFVECEDYRLKGTFTKEEAEAKAAELNSDEAPCPLTHRAVPIITTRKQTP